MRPVSRRHSRRGPVGGSTFRRTPISRSPLEKNPMPGHLSELHPVNEVHTKGQFFRASFGKKPRFQIQLDKRPLSPRTSREASGVPCLHPRRGLTLLWNPPSISLFFYPSPHFFASSKSGTNKVFLLSTVSMFSLHILSQITIIQVKSPLLYK